MMQLDLLAAPSARRFDPQTSRDAAESARELIAEEGRAVRNLHAVGTMAACKAIRNMSEQIARSESQYLSAVRGRQDFRDALRKASAR